MILIDNYDSFTYNIVQYLQELGLEPKVFENDKITIDKLKQMNFKSIIISPGAGNPDTAGVSMDVIKEFYKTKKILGICLGHQCIAQFFGGKIIKSPNPTHGKTSKIFFDEQSKLFKGLPQGFEVTRYHSLEVKFNTFSPLVGENACKTGEGETSKDIEQAFPRPLGEDSAEQNDLVSFCEREILNEPASCKNSDEGATHVAQLKNVDNVFTNSGEGKRLDCFTFVRNDEILSPLPLGEGACKADEGQMLNRDTLKITAQTSDGTIMAIEHETLPIYGVQFHPEAILTQYGHELLHNFITA